MLDLENVDAGYGQTMVLHDVSLSVRAGEIVALLGANGAGKTTVLMAISGLVSIYAGKILGCDTQLVGCPPSLIVAKGISHVPEGRRVLARLSVLENLELGAYTRQDRAAAKMDLERIFTFFPVLASRRYQLAGTLSGGEQQMLAIGRGLMARPKLLLLDEPSLGLAPKVVASVFEVIRRINEEGVSILLVEQNANLALEIAHRGYVLEAGRVALSDSAVSLGANPHVRAAYLGA